MTLQNTSDAISSPQEAYILVVEDNVPNFVMIARLLAQMGVNHCEWKTSGWQVVQFAPTLPQVDLIIMDIDLPYEDGYQALRKIRSHPRLHETRVIALTATANQDEVNRAQAAGFDGFLSKPLDAERFPSQIRRILANESVWEWR
ncbi:response regulator [Aggregatilinea lenta]|uniref:response regulator n=1 Tax=Aggregatilinea lenta TaxID=913108 RepID=UPI000E5BE3FD|nr:response regulator [Aggregatilinea lenta]